MKTKKYYFELTENQVELINELIGFKIRESIAWNAEEYEETLKLSNELNRQLGIYQGIEKQRKLMNEN